MGRCESDDLCYLFYLFYLFFPGPLLLALQPHLAVLATVEAPETCIRETEQWKSLPSAFLASPLAETGRVRRRGAADCGLR